MVFLGQSENRVGMFLSGVLIFFAFCARRAQSYLSSTLSVLYKAQCYINHACVAGKLLMILLLMNEVRLLRRLGVWVCSLVGVVSKVKILNRKGRKGFSQRTQGFNSKVFILCELCEKSSRLCVIILLRQPHFFMDEARRDENRKARRYFSTTHY